jgi:chromosome segregation ATPase
MNFIRYKEFERAVLARCHDLHPQDILAEGDKTASEISLLQGELDGTVSELARVTEEIENLTDSISTTPDRRVRVQLENRMSSMFDKQSNLERKRDGLDQQIETLSRAFETTQRSLDSLKKLFDFLDTAKAGNRRTEVRLKLRKELRRLIERIDVYPEGLSTIHAGVSGTDVEGGLGGGSEPERHPGIRTGAR